MSSRVVFDGISLSAIEMGLTSLKDVLNGTIKVTVNIINNNDISSDATSKKHNNVDASSNIICESCEKIKQINLSFNNLTENFFHELSIFVNLSTLILDNNKLKSLEEIQFLPFLPSLLTLWLNNNCIDDIEKVLTYLVPSSGSSPSSSTLNIDSNNIDRGITYSNTTNRLKKVYYPCQLMFLSLLRNKCCPNEMVPGGGASQYKRYRIYVKYRLPMLQVLDASPFSPEEEKKAKEVGKMYKVKYPSPHLLTTLNKIGDDEKDKCSKVIVNDGYVPPEISAFKVNKNSDGDSKKLCKKNNEDLFFNREKSLRRCIDNPYYVQQRHFYSGKASEGNRFIKDDVL